MAQLVNTLLLLFSLVITLAGQVRAYGEPINGLPSYQERTALSLINAARVGAPWFSLSLSLSLQHLLTLI